jgi:ElaB/YqjD/DUF883 family membrane-anchored ribosome-binding protein
MSPWVRRQFVEVMSGFGALRKRTGVRPRPSWSHCCSPWMNAVRRADDSKSSGQAHEHVDPLQPLRLLPAPEGHRLQNKSNRLGISPHLDGARPILPPRNFFVEMSFQIESKLSIDKVKLMTTRAKVREVGGIVSDVRDKGREAVEAVGEVRDNLQNGLDKSLKTRPYTTLMLAVGVGFVLGALWAR